MQDVGKTNDILRRLCPPDRRREWKESKKKRLHVDGNRIRSVAAAVYVFIVKKTFLDLKKTVCARGLHNNNNSGTFKKLIG